MLKKSNDIGFSVTTFPSPVFNHKIELHIRSADFKNYGYVVCDQDRR